MKFTTAGREKRREIVCVPHGEGQVLLCVPGSGEKQRDCVSVPFSQLAHTPQIYSLIVVGSLNTFSLRIWWPEWPALLWASLGTLSVVSVRASWELPQTVSLLATACPNNQCVFMCELYRFLVNDIFSLFAFVAGEPRAKLVSSFNCSGSSDKCFWSSL